MDFCHLIHKVYMYEIYIEPIYMMNILFRYALARYKKYQLLQNFN